MSGRAHDAGTEILKRKQSEYRPLSAIDAGTVTAVMALEEPPTGVPMSCPWSSATACTTCAGSSGEENSGLARLHAAMLRKTNTNDTVKTRSGLDSTASVNTRTLPGRWSARGAWRGVAFTELPAKTVGGTTNPSTI